MVYHPLVAFLLFVITYQHVTIAASAKRASNTTPKPTPPVHISNRYGADDIPDECKDQNYCTIRPTDYPEEDVNKMFKGMNRLRLPSLVTDVTLVSRLGYPGERDDCDSTVTFDPIYRIRTKRDSEWTVVVQAPEFGYEQRVRLEKCDQPSARCFDPFPEVTDLRVFCKQKYSRWEILVLNGTSTDLVAVDLPTCCSCVYEKISLN